MVCCQSKILNVVEQSGSPLNQLQKHLPEGLVVDAAWLNQHGIASNLRAYYVSRGWLAQPARSLYRRPRGDLSWQQVVISLQTLLLRTPLIVGGRTALELQGYAHYVSRETSTVHLYGPQKPPGWLLELNLDQDFVYHNSAKLFPNAPLSICDGPARGSNNELGKKRIHGPGLTTLEWGQWGWEYTLSQPERAYLEMLDELPNRESFHQADMIMQGAATFSPRRLQQLLGECASVKVKRLFFFFANRHRHVWLDHIDKRAIDLGTGKRMLVRGGRLDPEYQITVPRDLDAIQ